MSEPAPQAGRPKRTARPAASPAATSSAAPPPNGERPVNGTATTSPSTLRRAILLHLRQSGPTSPDGLATALGASRTGVLQQLHALEGANLVGHRTEKHGVGRPRHLYDVTPDAQDLFPADYHGFARGLIAAIEAVGGEALLEEVLAARRRQMGANVKARFDDRVRPGMTLGDRVRELAVIQDGGGYLAEALVDGDGSLRLREHNCAIFRLARESTSCCDAELALFRDVLDAEVVRETHIASGDRSCTYRVEPRSAD